MDWRLKALAFRVLDLPGGTYAHYFLQRHVTRNWPRPAKTLDALQNIARRVVEDYARHVGGTPSSALEIGAGRDLAVPLALRKLGVVKVITSDVDRLARLDLIQHAAARIVPGEARLDSWESLQRFGIFYAPPGGGFTQVHSAPHEWHPREPRKSPTELEAFQAAVAEAQRFLQVEMYFV